MSIVLRALGNFPLFHLTADDYDGDEEEYVIMSFGKSRKKDF